MPEIIGECRLCKKHKKLINSHIVPEGFYENMYDEKKRVYSSSESRNEFDILQKGYREFLLCSECDGGIIGNRYDKYGTEVIRDRLHIEYLEDDEKEIWLGLDYNKFKIFLLSILWRSHIAQKNYTGITLDDKTASMIVDSIRSGIAPKEEEIPIMAYSLKDPHDENDKCDGIITNGNTYSRMGLSSNSKTSVIIFGGYAWNFVIPTADKNDYWDEYFLKDYEFGIMQLPKTNIFEYPPLTHVIKNLDYASKNIERVNRRKK